MKKWILCILSVGMLLIASGMSMVIGLCVALQPHPLWALGGFLSFLLIAVMCVHKSVMVVRRTMKKGE